MSNKNHNDNNYGTIQYPKKNTIITDEADDNDSLNIIAEQLPLTKTPESPPPPIHYTYERLILEWTLSKMFRQTNLLCLSSNLGNLFLFDSNAWLAAMFIFDIIPMIIGRCRCNRLALPKGESAEVSFSYDPYKFTDLKINSLGKLYKREVHIFQNNDNNSTNINLDVRINSLNPAGVDIRFEEEGFTKTLTAVQDYYPLFPDWGFIGSPSCGTVLINIHLPKKFSNPSRILTNFDLDGYDVFVFSNKFPIEHETFKINANDGFIFLDGIHLKNFSIWGNIGGPNIKAIRVNRLLVKRFENKLQVWISSIPLEFERALFPFKKINLQLKDTFSGKYDFQADGYVYVIGGGSNRTKIIDRYDRQIGFVYGGGESQLIVTAEGGDLEVKF
ncbi:7415_t:CDS:2 [Ambispora gerdemannii]|uniref:7415_t:CDS:1 n=1 Tax=Ambispora gerdemannii TaxID=144530 RepID=A0A9N9CYE1_9GLOM|nr:7415_t:CDS:2 [Ambispora gerdemannii]